MGKKYKKFNTSLDYMRGSKVVNEINPCRNKGRKIKEQEEEKEIEKDVAGIIDD